jgi:hypothetical protein
MELVADTIEPFVPKSARFWMPLMVHVALKYDLVQHSNVTFSQLASDAILSYVIPSCVERAFVTAIALEIHTPMY